MQRMSLIRRNRKLTERRRKLIRTKGTLINLFFLKENPMSRNIHNQMLASLLLLMLPSPASADKVDNYIKMEMHRQRIPGASVAILREGKVVRAKGYGLANLELPASATENTVYPIASMTKQFTATA